jgi:hypothetical protein
MHPIPKERARAHWRALVLITPDRRLRLRARLMEEHRHLTNFIFVATAYIPGKSHLDDPPIEDHPYPERFALIADLAAVLCEMMRRESRRPLRCLSSDQVTSITANVGSGADCDSNAIEDRNNKIIENCAQSEALEAAWEELQELDYAPVLGDLRSIILDLLRAAMDYANAASEHPDGSTFEPMDDWTVDRIELALSVCGDPMRREALAAAESFRADLIPRLLAELEAWVADPDAASSADGAFGMHALY